LVYLPAAPKNLPSPLSASGGKVVKPMMTLVEEQHQREVKPLLNQDTEDVSLVHVSKIKKKKTKKKNNNNKQTRSLDTSAKKLQ
jgi:hypothetical protein